MVPITSDKGLCGGINSGIVREVRAYVGERTRENIEIFCIGDKGAVGLTRQFKDLIKVGISEISIPYNYSMVMAVSDHIIANSEEKDKIVVFYNEFKSAISQESTRLELMPRERFLDTLELAKLYEMSAPDKNTANPALYELYLTSNLWLAFLNNAASEQSARVNAMENASKNAAEILDALTLKYNKARQARITMELVEIISGASAL